MDQIVTIGRRKRAVARVILKQDGGGEFTVNKRPMAEYFPLFHMQLKLKQPLAAIEANEGDYSIKVNVNGGGFKGQTEAIRLGIARALVELDSENKPALKREGLMTRDARKVERKKYGKKKARKSSQFSKR